jgi:hypothetical protein
MTRLEFCKEVLYQFDGHWPFPGSLGMASGCYSDKRSVEYTVTKLRAEKEKRLGNKDKRNFNAR